MGQKGRHRHHPPYGGSIRDEIIRDFTTYAPLDDQFVKKSGVFPTVNNSCVSGFRPASGATE